jgi:hypothetical protein
VIDNPRAVCKYTTPCADRPSDREHRLVSGYGSTIQEGINDTRKMGEISDAEIADGAKGTIR